MACRLCRLEIDTTLCEVCRFLTEAKLPELPATCENCGFPIDNPAESGSLCQLCTALLKAVQGSGYLLRAHAEWEQENILLARRKWELLGTGGSAAF